MSEQAPAPVPEQLTTECLTTAEDRQSIALISGESHPDLAQDVANHLGIELIPVEFKRFPNGDLYARLEENVRRREVFIMQSHVEGNGLTISESNRQHQELINAARNAGARRIYAIAPTYAGARQDRRAKPREANSSGITLRGLYNEGAKELITVEPHNLQALENGYPGIATPITPRYELQEPIRPIIAADMDNALVIGGDLGSAKLAAQWAKDLGLDYKVYPKERDPVTGKVTHPTVSAHDVEGQTCVIPDDMIDTAGTLESLAKKLLQARAKRLIVAATHLWLSEDAVEILDASGIELIVGGDTIPTKEAKQRLGKQLLVVSTARITADAAVRVNRGESVSEQPYGRVYS